MGELTPSFLAEISKYEETLAKDTDSFCFAPLADLYRKNGLVDEAIKTAQLGCDRHPNYVGGFMALGRAYFEKGMKEESKTALEKVVAATPDNHLAQKLLSQLYLETGDTEAATDCLKFMLSSNPDDTESRDLLGSLQPGEGSAAKIVEESSISDAFSFDTEIHVGTALENELAFDEVEIIEELTEEISDETCGLAATDCEAPHSLQNGTERKDPLKTATLAELYVSQGFLSSASSIYQELLISEPGNSEYKKRLVEIQRVLAADHEREVQQMPGDAPADIGETSIDVACHEHSEAVSDVLDPVARLENWLENIQRRR